MSPHPEAGAKERPAGTREELTVMKEFWAEFGVLPAALGAAIAAWEPERAVLTSSGPALCRQVGSRQWVGEVLETLAALSAGLLATGLGEQPQTIVAPYGATVRTIYHLRPSSSDWVEAEARWVRRGRSQAVIETVVRDAEGRELLRVLSQHAAIPEPLVFSLAGPLPSQVKTQERTREQASNPNLATMDAIRDAMRREDWDRLAGFLAPGAALTLHGTGPLCGVFEGRAPFVAALQRLRSATAGVLRPEPVAVAASGDWVTSQIRVRGDREGRAIETLEFISYRFRDGLAVEAHFIPADQREFWEYLA